MANNYLQFSFSCFDKLTPAEKIWLDVRADDRWWEDNKPAGEDFRGFDMEVKDDLWIYAEESGYVDNVMWLLREFIKVFRPKDHVIFTWSYTCDKMRVDEFGGGAALVTKNETVVFHPDALAQQYLEQGECEPHVYNHATAIEVMGDAVHE
jgi:hypothetical protein